MFYPQGNSFYPQGSFGAQGSFNPQGSFGAQGNFNGNFNPQTSFGPQGVQGYPGGIPFANTPYGYPQQPHLLAHQLAALQFATQHPSGLIGLGDPHHQLLQQLAQYHYLVAQQLAQLAAQQAVQSAGSPYAGQFIPGQQFVPGQLGANFVPGFTMH
jgi:hypothetical protein